MYFLGNYIQERFIKSRESYVDKNRNNYGIWSHSDNWLMGDGRNLS